MEKLCHSLRVTELVRCKAGNSQVLAPESMLLTIILYILSNLKINP